MKNKYHLCFCSFKKSRRFFIRNVPVFFFIIVLSIPGLIQAQNNTAQKEAQVRLEKTASDYFEQDDLTNAYPLYSQLLSIYPHDPNYNYRLGACMLYANANKKKAIKYIQYALKQPSVDNLAYYYMGRAFHLNYRFDEAISSYEKFEELASSSELKKHPVKQLIEMCRNGKQLLAASQPLDVLRKKQLNFSIFYEAYSMRSNGGVLIAEPEEFKTKMDKKNKLSGLMYLTPDKSEAFFASYGNTEDNGKDIYCIRKKPDGTWGTAENLGTVINSAFDEDYPVYDARRNTLYFSSKGHNSMGGYDIFSSVYNDTTETWSEPYNLDFPINTPDDDILLVPDTSGQIAFFASARSSPQGKIEVYKITLHLHPPGTLVVAGTVHNGAASAYAIITVRDSATNKVVAIDTTQDGSYSLALPQSGKYVFTVQDSAHKIQSKSLELNPTDNRVAVEENIQLNASGSLQIDNVAPQASGSSNSEVALQYIEREAKMDVNVDTTASLQKLLAQSVPNKSNNTLTASSASVKHDAPAAQSESKDTLIHTPSPNPGDNNADNGSTEVAQNIPTKAITKEPVVNDTSSQVSEDNNANNSSTEVTQNMPAKAANETHAVKDTSSQVSGDNNADNGSTEVAKNIPAKAITKEPAVDDTSSQISGNNNADNGSTEVVKNRIANAITKAQVVKDTSSQSFGDNNADNGSTEIAKNAATKAITKVSLVKDTSSQVSVDNNTDNGSTEAAKSAPTIVDSAKVEQLGRDKQQLDDKAGAATDYANSKMEQARQLQERADDISNSGNRNSDSVAILSEKAKLATEKAMQAYKLAATYKTESGAKQTEINKTENITRASGGDLKVAVNDQPANNNSASVSPGDLIRQQAQQVKADSVQLAADNTEDAKEVTELQQKSADFITQANQTNDSQQKVALLQQADDLSKSKDTKQEEIKQNNTQLQELHAQYAWLNNRARSADSVSVASNGKADNAGVESQAELQKEVDNYAANEGVDSASGANPSEAVANTSPATSSLNDTIQVAKHTKHTHRKKNNNNNRAEEPGNIAATGSPINDTALAENNRGKSISPDDNSIAANNTGINEPKQTISTDAPVIKDTNGTNAVSMEVSHPGNTIPANRIATSEKNYSQHPDTTVYYKQPHDTLLDSIANAMSISQDPLNFSSGEATQNSSSATTVQYTDTTAIALAQKSQSYLTASAILSDTVMAIRNQAKTEHDKAKATLLYARADSINALAYQLNVKGNKISAEADERQYAANADKTKKITADASISSDKATIARLKLKDAEDSYTEYVWERDSANTTASLAGKRSYMEAATKDLAQAIIKQQRAVSIYFKADSSQAAVVVNAPSDSRSSIQTTSSDENRKASDTSDANNNAEVTHLSPVSPVQIVKTDDTSPKEEVTSEPVNIKQVAPVSVNPTSSEDTKVSPEKSDNVAVATENNSSPADSSSDNATPAKTINDEPVPVKEAAEPALAANHSQPESMPDSVNTFIATKDVNTSAYSASKPIPIDPSLPTGVVFGVQIGAFRKPIPPDLFRGFEPIMGLKTKEGLVRYIAGTFETFEPAKNAAAKIRGMGYAGAFVVAFYNGKRITIKEALAILGVSPAEEARMETAPVATSETSPGSSNKEAETASKPIASNTLGDNKTTQYTGNTTIPSKKELIDNKRKDIKAIKDSIPPAAADIKDVKGLVYTVQVGSFSKRKGFARLQKIKQLYYWSSNTDGTIKYNSGIYTNVSDARAAKDIIVANTVVKDAFVTAYYKGQRVTPAEAASLLSKGETPGGSAPANNTKPQINEAPKNEDAENGLFASASSEKVIYTVRIASFTGKLPVDTVNKLLSYASEGIQPYLEKQGVTTYYAGALTDYESAETLRQKFYNGGFRHAIVEAFYRGKKISLQEAQTIKNK